MISKERIFLAFFLLSNLCFTSHKIQSYYTARYFSDWEVFQIIETKDDRGFNEWMRSRPQVNIFNEYGQTPLMIAAKLQHTSFVLRLLDAGANRHYVDCFGKTARDYALEAESMSYNNVSVPPVACSGDDLWSSIGTGLAVGAAAGLAAYAIYGLCEALEDLSVSARYDNADYYNSYDYCMRCHSYIVYTSDPKALYCNNCYRIYCNQQRMLNSRVSCRLSDRL